MCRLAGRHGRHNARPRAARWPIPAAQWPGTRMPVKGLAFRPRLLWMPRPWVQDHGDCAARPDLPCLAAPSLTHPVLLSRPLPPPLQSKMEEMKDDPELKEVMEDIEKNGQGAMMKYMQVRGVSKTSTSRRGGIPPGRATKLLAVLRLRHTRRHQWGGWSSCRIFPADSPTPPLSHTPPSPTPPHYHRPGRMRRSCPSWAASSRRP